MVFSKDGENTIEDECKVFFAVLNFFVSGGQQGDGRKRDTYEFGKEIPECVFLLSLPHNRSSSGYRFMSRSRASLHLVIQRDEQDAHTKPHQRLSLFARPQPESAE